MKRYPNIEQLLDLNKLRDDVVKAMQRERQFESLAKEGKKLIDEGAHEEAQEKFRKANELMEPSQCAEKKQVSTSKGDEGTFSESVNEFGKAAQNYIGMFQKRNP